MAFFGVEATIIRKRFCPLYYLFHESLPLERFQPTLLADIEDRLLRR